jgi:predicted transcriptional regulator
MHKIVDLLDMLQKEHANLLIQGHSDEGSPYTIFRLGFNEVDETALSISLKDQLGPPGDEIVYFISMRGIDIISPSAAKALVTGAVDMMKQRKVPVVFTEVSQDALQGLQTVNNIRQFEKVLWAVGVDRRPDFVGTVPDRFKRILALLEEKGGASASDLAEAEGGESSKRNVNRFSVYLQELYDTGLVVREKVSGSNRDGERGERGWTYMYRPAYSLVAPS